MDTKVRPRQFEDVDPYKDGPGLYFAEILGLFSGGNSSPERTYRPLEANAISKSPSPIFPQKRKISVIDLTISSPEISLPETKKRRIDSIPLLNIEDVSCKLDDIPQPHEGDVSDKARSASTISHPSNFEGFTSASFSPQSTEQIDYELDRSPRPYWKAPTLNIYAPMSCKIWLGTVISAGPRIRPYGRESAMVKPDSGADLQQCFYGYCEMKEYLKEGSRVGFGWNDIEGQDQIMCWSWERETQRELQSIKSALQEAGFPTD